MALNTQLRAYRLRQNMTLREVAARVDITERTLINYEQGKAEPKASTLHKLADLFGTTMSALYGERSKAAV